MKKLALFLICSITLSTQGFALLSPLNQSLKEIEAILARGELGQTLPQAEEIEEIRREDDSYIVSTKSKMVQIDVIYQPSQKIGPREFQLEFHKAESIND